MEAGVRRFYNLALRALLCRHSIRLICRVCCQFLNPSLQARGYGSALFRDAVSHWDTTYALTTH